jgi:hypothetical protein
MQPVGYSDRIFTPRPARLRGALLRLACAAALSLTCGSVVFANAGADDREFDSVEVGASNGGTANATSGGNVNIGEIVTGENQGNSINTGDIVGNAEINGGTIDYPTDVDVSQDIGPLIASADGGDEGKAEGPATKPPEYNVNIDNIDKDKNINRNDATGVGEGGQGGTGGSGGTINIPATP